MMTLENAIRFASASAGGALRLRPRLAFFLVLLAPLALAAPASAGSETRGPLGERVSDELTRTYWATPARAAPIRRLPSPTAQSMARLRFLTEDGFPEVYVVLRRFTDADGRTWLRIRIPMRPNGQRGWVREHALGGLNLVRTRLVVNRALLRATLYRSGQKVWQARVGIGGPSTPTPAGRFWIRERIAVSNPSGIYGPWAFGTSAYSVLSDWPGGGVIGIHGTNQPGLIPGRPSHGCIRLRNKAIMRLAALLPVGTPVRIR